MRIVLIFLLSFTQTSLLSFEREDVTIKDSSYNYEKNWILKGRNDQESINRLFEILATSKTGRFIIDKSKSHSQKKNKRLGNSVLVGPNSITDTTLIRKFTPSDPSNVTYRSESKVFINRNLKLRHAVLDLAHELTHFVYREAFNPYRDNFDIKGFISSTVEGQGGEADAFLVECRVSKELFGLNQNSSCLNIYNHKDGKFSKGLAVKYFYQLGGEYRKFSEKIKHYGHHHHFPHANNKSAEFISSAYDLPYPMAAVLEYEGIMERVCLNDSRRMVFLKEEQRGRSPASSEAKSYKNVEKSLKKRCEFFL